MDLYSPIFTRKSVRKYEMTPLSKDTLEALENVIKGVTPLSSSVQLSHKIVGPDDVKGLGIAKAPHYLMISGKDHVLRNVSAGYVYQHAELYLYSAGYATRWLNGVKTKQDNPDHVIGLAFGKPAEAASRKTEEFDRKPLSEIAKGTDERLKAARLAPSGMNGQPWYYIVDNDTIYVYYKESLGGVMGRLYHKTDLDAGISLCHLAVASEHEGKAFHFSADGKGAPKAPEGFKYLGTVTA